MPILIWAGRKHIARHEKPHKCHHPPCDYASATANDLERHTRSKHLASLLDGRPLKTHLCSLEPCKSQGRKFPRLDNFRNHLRKKHNLVEGVVEHLVRRSVMLWRISGLAYMLTRSSAAGKACKFLAQESGAKVETSMAR